MLISAPDSQTLQSEDGTPLEQLMRYLKSPTLWIISILLLSMTAMIAYIGSFQGDAGALARIGVQPASGAVEVYVQPTTTDDDSAPLRRATITPAHPDSILRVSSSDLTPTVALLGLTRGPTAPPISITPYFLLTAYPTAGPSSDTTPPQVLIIAPQPGGSITTYTGGRVCVSLAPPRDDVSKPTEIAIHYAFDTQSLAVVSQVNTLCADSLPNGTHILQYYGVDEAGNTESLKTLSFIVQIPGNDPTPTPSPSLTPTLTRTPTPTPTPTP